LKLFILFIYFLGSILGGANLVIMGDGFIGETILTFDAIYSLTQDTLNMLSYQMQYDSITIVTNPNDEVDFNISVTVNGIDAICRVHCNYNFSADYTPIVSSVYPLSVSGLTEITINGTGFSNDTTMISVKVGNQPCLVTASSETEIICNLTGLEFGKQSIVVNLNGIYLIFDIFEKYYI
jgi:hypothetical protein